MRLITVTAALAIALVAIPVGANEPLTYDEATSRLRACASSGATNNHYSSLREAIITVRSLCKPQINRVYKASDVRVAANNRAASNERLAELRAMARRQIDRDLAMLISTQTGLAQ